MQIGHDQPFDWSLDSLAEVVGSVWVSADFTFGRTGGNEGLEKVIPFGDFLLPWLLPFDFRFGALLNFTIIFRIPTNYFTVKIILTRYNYV